jgi:hypothetical protein
MLVSHMTVLFLNVPTVAVSAGTVISDGVRNAVLIHITEMGHGSKFCKGERATIDRVEVKCVNCSATGHRARDCVEKRRDPFTCRNCGYDIP